MDGQTGAPTWRGGILFPSGQLGFIVTSEDTNGRLGMGSRLSPCLPRTIVRVALSGKPIIQPMYAQTFSPGHTPERFHTNGVEGGKVKRRVQ